MIAIRQRVSAIKLTKRHKAGAALVLLALCALIADRLFVLPQSAPAQQDVYSMPSDSKSAGSVSAQSPAAGAPPVNPRLAKLDAIWSSEGRDLRLIRDAFAVPSYWREDPDAATVRLGGLKSDPSYRFLRRHRLIAVAAVGAGQNAVYVDDLLLSVGQELDGFKLVAADRQSVTFEYEGQKIVLKLTGDR
jgi:hypothetical protein